MTDDHTYFRWMVQKAQIRAGARAIILSARDGYFNFIGGGVELGETLEACLKREIREETNARVIRVDYLFVVENFITFKGDITHSLGRYFEVQLDREDLKSTLDNTDLMWFSRADLADLDLRPHVVRNHIVNRTYQSVRHLISKDDIA